MALLLCMSADAPDMRRVPFFLIPYNSSNKSIVSFDTSELKNKTNKYSITLNSQACDCFSDSKEIGLLIVSNWNDVRYISAELLVSDLATGEILARYNAKQNGLIKENRELVFLRYNLMREKHENEKQVVTINILTSHQVNIGLVGEIAELDQTSKKLWVELADINKHSVVNICGSRDAEIKGGKLSRAELLAYLWGFSPHGNWIVYTFIIIATVLWGVGLSMIHLMLCQSEGFQKSLFMAVACSLIFLSGGVVLAILIPPFQTPDEPSHFITYSQLNGRADLQADALRLANSGHFERIKFRQDEHFSTIDVGQPMNENWASHIQKLEPNRSHLTNNIWILCGMMLKYEHAGLVLLGLRVINIIFVCLCYAAALVLAAWALHPETPSIFLSAPIILTPSVTFFSIGVSNYPMLIGGIILQTIALGILWSQSIDRKKKYRLEILVGVLCGLGISLSIGASDNGLFSLVFWGLMIPLYRLLCILHSRDLSTEMKNLLYFTSGFTVSIITVLFLCGLFFSESHLIPIMFPDFLKKYIYWILTSLVNIKMMLCVFFIILTIMLSAAMLGIGYRLNKYACNTLGNIALTSVLTVLLYLVIFKSKSQITEDHMVKISEYSLQITRSFFMWFDSGRNDFLVSKSFWGCFGWLDLPLPNLCIFILKSLSAFGILILTFLVLKPGSYFAGKGFLIATILSIFFYVSAIAIGYYSALNGITGRYLIGAYLLFLTVSFEGYRRTFNFLPTSQVSSIANYGVCIACIIIQFVSWVAIVNRYY